jgi:hypothetical protein
MCSVAHVAVGAVLGGFLGNSLLSFGTGFASHIPLDAIPHFDFKDFKVDAAVTLGLLGAVMVAAPFTPVFFGALGAVLPDFENLLWKLKIIGEKRKVFPTHSGLIRHGRATASGGLRTEILVSILCAIAVAVVVLIRGGVS